MRIISKSLNDTQKFAREVLSKLRAFAKSDLVTQSTTSQKQSPASHQPKATILLLEGDLGSGKTTFTQTLARELGVKENLTSPTFVLMKSYQISKESTERFHLSVKNLVHIDAYRLNSGQDLLNLGWAELIANPESLIVVEWPEKVADLWDGTEHKLNFKFIDDQTREIIVNL